MLDQTNYNSRNTEKYEDITHMKYMYITVYIYIYTPIFTQELNVWLSRERN